MEGSPLLDVSCLGGGVGGKTVRIHSNWKAPYMHAALGMDAALDMFLKKSGIF